MLISLLGAAPPWMAAEAWSESDAVADQGDQESCSLLLWP